MLIPQKAILAAALTLVTGCAQAGELYGVLEAGQAEFGRRSDGGWWQSAFPHRFDFTTGTLAAGAGYKFTRHIRLEGRIHLFGAARHYAEYANDDGFNQFNRCQGPENAAKCIEMDGYYHSQHRTKSHAISLAAIFNVGKPYVKVGYYAAEHDTYTTHVVVVPPPYIPSAELEAIPGVGDVFHNSYTWHQRNWLIGVGYDFNDRLSINYEFLYDFGRGPTTVKDVQTLTFSFRF